MLRAQRSVHLSLFKLDLLRSPQREVQYILTWMEPGDMALGVRSLPQLNSRMDQSAVGVGGMDEARMRV